MGIDEVKYIYDCLEYNVLQSRLALAPKNVYKVNAYSDDWARHSRGNSCLRRYMNNKSEMGRDVVDNGMYLPFIATIKTNGSAVDKAILDSGGHRLEGLREYYNKNPEHIKDHIFIFHNKDDVSSDFCYYIAKKHYEFPRDTHMGDFYIDNSINKKYFVKDLKYGMCLIRYNVKSIHPIKAVMEYLSAEIWRWNNANKDNTVKAKELFNDIFYFIKNKEKSTSRLYKKLVGEECGERG